MDGILQFDSQQWRPERIGELTLFLFHSSLAAKHIHFSGNLSFVPLWLGDEDNESEHRTLHLDIEGTLPEVWNWRELAGMELEGRDPIEVNGEIITPGRSRPEVSLWSSGPGGIHQHAKDGWDPRIVFGAAEEDGYELAVEISAFYPTPAASKAMVDLMMKQFFNEPETAEDLEKELLLEQGRKFHYTGRVRFGQVDCTVPINAADPVGYARKMAKQRLNFTEPCRGRVNGADWSTGAFKPQDGIDESGRLVLLYPERQAV